MRFAKKLSAAALTAVLSLGLAAGALAGEVPGEVPGGPGEAQEPITAGTSASVKGSITIDNAVEGQTYALYQILELESFDSVAGAYSYKATPAWAEWVAGQTDYVAVDEQGYVTWIADESAAAAFAKAAQAYAEGQGIEALESAVAEGATVAFTELTLGYYLVDSSLGALCALDTTQPDVVMKEKNQKPIIIKEVQEDSLVETEGEGWGETNDADMGQVVDYRATITAYPGAQGYLVHDKFSEGLDFVADSVAIEGLAEVAEAQLEDGTVSRTGDYVVVLDPECEDGCDFHVVFEQAYLDTIAAPTQIVIAYSAVVNGDAVVAGAGNPNDVKLTYGNEFDTEWDRVVTYTWDMDVLKFANGVEEDVLEGVEFVLLNADKTMAAAVVDGKVTAWVEVPAEGDEWPEATVLTTDEAGSIAIDGLDADTYYLREIKAPAGFNMLAEDVEVEVKAAAEKTDEETGETKVVYETYVAKVNNQSGVELPSTGGIGTTIFYAVGSVLVLGAIVLLVTKMRMGSRK